MNLIKNNSPRLIVNCGEVVNRRRVERGLTIRSLARLSGVPESALYNILQNSRKMTASELLALSIVLGLGFDDYTKERAG